jgi:hypothetical protein
MNMQTRKSFPDNKEYLKYLLRTNALRFNNNEERDVIRKMLVKGGYYKKEQVDAVLLCLKCKQRMRADTAGALLHCKCNTLYWKSDGPVLYFYSPSKLFHVILKHPQYVEKTSEHSNASEE